MIFIGMIIPYLNFILFYKIMNEFYGIFKKLRMIRNGQIVETIV